MLQIYYIYNLNFIKILLCHVSQPLSEPLYENMVSLQNDARFGSDKKTNFNFED